MATHQVLLAHPADVSGWRSAARQLLAGHVRAEDVTWYVPDENDVNSALFELAPAAAAPAEAPGAASLRVPAAFIELAQHALLHSEPQRFALAYRLLTRLIDTPELRHDPLDEDRLRLRALAQAVRRDLHKMKAFVRFTERTSPHGPHYVAWFEPDHYIEEEVAPFFARRFAGMQWSIFTPRRSLHWRGRELHIGPGARRGDVVGQGDAHEQLWLTYYESIFNPARLKLDAMCSEMPRKYWHNLPEARLIAPLAATATARAQAMVEQPATEPQRKLPAWQGPHATHPDDAKAAAAACLACPHARHATQTVWGEGPPQARTVIVGEQPGDLEDLQGRPFVGPAGQLLDRALGELGLERGQFYLTNAVKHFRFEWRGKRRLHKTPGQQEVQACAQWLAHELRSVAPRRIVALGATAAAALLGRRVPVNEFRGQWLPRADGVPVLVAWHPAALLRLPETERAAAYAQWLADLRQLGS